MNYASAGSLVAAFRSAASRFGAEGEVLTDSGRRITFGEFDETVRRLASSLARAGIEAGDVVAYWLPNWWEAAAAFYGIAAAGGVACAITPALRESEAGFILDQARPKAIFCPEEFRGFAHAEFARDFDTDLFVISVRGRGVHVEMTSFEGLVASGSAEFEPDEADPGDDALILYTSGTTSVPKGVVHTHGGLAAELASLGPAHGLGDGDVVFMPMPVTHIAGFEYAIGAPLYYGARSVFLDRWDAGRALDLIAAEGVTVQIAAPVFVEDELAHAGLVSTDLSSMRMISLGGAGVTPDLVERARAAFTGAVVKRTYGSTEHPTVTTSANGAAADRQTFSEGRVIGANEVRLVDAELWTRGPELFRGYVDASLDVEVLSDGWFRTGDLADVDSDGYVTITGRRKDVIIRGGENISASEVEAALCRIEGVSDAAVVGVADARMGETVAAFVVAGADAAVLSDDAIRERLWRGGLAKFKTPETITWRESLPRTPSGKVRKDELRDTR